MPDMIVLFNPLYLHPVCPFPTVLTCEMSEAQVHQSILVIEVEEDREGPFLIIQHAATDHSQLLQRKPAKLVCGDQDVACHFPNSLQAEARE